MGFTQFLNSTNAQPSQLLAFCFITHHLYYLYLTHCSFHSSIRHSVSYALLSHVKSHETRQLNIYVTTNAITLLTNENNILHLKRCVSTMLIKVEFTMTERGSFDKSWILYHEGRRLFCFCSKYKRLLFLNFHKLILCVFFSCVTW